MSVIAEATRRRPAPVTRRARTARFAAAVVAVAVVAGVTSPATPTGVSGADFVWRAVLAGLAAYLAGTARRWTWFVPAGAAAALGGGGAAVAGAALAVGIGLWSVLTDTRSRARGALVGGLGCTALLQAEPVVFHGFTAIVTVAAVAPLAASGYGNAGRRAQSRLRKLGLAAAVLCGLAVAGAVLGVLSVSRDLTQGARLIDDGITAARGADDDLAGERLQQAARHLTSAEATLDGWFVTPARLLPVVGPNLDAVASLADEAGQVARVAAAAARVADVDQLRFVDGRLDPAAVEAMEEPLMDTVDALAGLSTTVDRTDSPWLAAPLANRLDHLRSQLAGATPDAELALDAVRLAPDLLGASGPRRYLVLFTTPVEARGRSGFPGNFAELVIHDGKLSMPRFGRISELEQGGVPGPQRTLTQPPDDYVARYSRFDVATTWRNLTMGADFPSVALAIGELYPQSGGQPIDGVLAVDPIGLAALLRYTGPVDVPGLAEPLTTENAAQFLLLDQYVRFTEVSRRIDVLERVARTTFERLTSADLPGPRAVSEQLDPVVDGGHIQFVSLHDAEFLKLQEYNLTGALSPIEDGHDPLAVTSSNAGGSKIDLFLQRELRYEATWNPADGTVVGTITATLTNNAPASGLPDYVIGNALGLPPGTNRSYVSIYTRHDVAQARIDGQPAALQSEDEAGRRVYSTFVTIPPGGTVTIELDVTGRVEDEDDPDAYQLDLSAQPLVLPEQADVAVTVAGGGRLEAGAGVEVDGRTVRWRGALDRSREVRVGVG